MATVYKKVSSRLVTNYQVAINKAAQELCLKNPGLLKEMIAKAHEHIITAGFKFGKRKYRLKLYSDDMEPVKKQSKLLSESKGWQMLRMSYMILINKLDLKKNR